MKLNPKQFEEYLDEYLRLATAASFRAGKNAGVLHAIGEHDAENKIIDAFNDTLDIGAAELAKIGNRLDGYILAERLASGEADVIPGEWRVV